MRVYVGALLLSGCAIRMTEYSLSLIVVLFFLMSSVVLSGMVMRRAVLKWKENARGRIVIVRWYLVFATSLAVGIANSVYRIRDSLAWCLPAFIEAAVFTAWITWILCAVCQIVWGRPKEKRRTDTT